MHKFHIKQVKVQLEGSILSVYMLIQLWSGVVIIWGHCFSYELAGGYFDPFNTWCAASNLKWPPLVMWLFNLHNSQIWLITVDVYIESFDLVYLSYFYLYFSPFYTWKSFEGTVFHSKFSRFLVMRVCYIKGLKIFCYLRFDLVMGWYYSLIQ